MAFNPSLPHSAEELRILLMPSDERTVQRYGIDFESIRYQCSDLTRVRTLLPTGAAVRIKYDPGDLGAIYVFDPVGTKHWIKVPAVAEDYAKGLSLWKHRVIRSYVLREKREVDIFALAAAKKKIQDIVAREYRATRKGRGRKKAARFLDIGLEPAPSTGGITSDAYQGGLAIGTSSQEEATSGDTPTDSEKSKPPQPREGKPKSTRTSTSVPKSNQKRDSEDTELDTTGWGSNYD